MPSSPVHCQEERYLWQKFWSVDQCNLGGGNRYRGGGWDVSGWCSQPHAWLPLHKSPSSPHSQGLQCWQNRTPGWRVNAWDSNGNQWLNIFSLSHSTFTKEGQYVYLVVSHFWNALWEVGGIIVLLVGAIRKFDLTATWLLVNTPSDR